MTGPNTTLYILLTYHHPLLALCCTSPLPTFRGQYFPLGGLYLPFQVQQFLGLILLDIVNAECSDPARMG